jgi:hypothetical protein
MQLRFGVFQQFRYSKSKLNITLRLVISVPEQLNIVNFGLLLTSRLLIFVILQFSSFK